MAADGPFILHTRQQSTDKTSSTNISPRLETKGLSFLGPEPCSKWCKQTIGDRISIVWFQLTCQNFLELRLPISCLKSSLIPLEKNVMHSVPQSYGMDKQLCHQIQNSVSCSNKSFANKIASYFL